MIWVENQVVFIYTIQTFLIYLIAVENYLLAFTFSNLKLFQFIDVQKQQQQKQKQFKILSI